MKDNYKNISNITELRHAMVEASAELRAKEKELGGSFEKVRESFTFGNISLAISRKVMGMLSISTLLLKGVALAKEILSKQTADAKETAHGRQDNNKDNNTNIKEDKDGNEI